MPARVKTSVMVLPCIMLSEVEAGVAVSVGAAVTARVMVLETVRPSPVAVTMRVAEPTVAVDAAVRVRVDEPAALASVAEVLLQEAVTPVGRPVTVRATAPLKALLPDRETTSVTVLPCMTVSAVDVGVAVNVGAAVTARVMVLETVKPSPVAVTVTVAEEAMVAVAVAVRVRVDEPASFARVTGLLLQAAVTPVGKPATLRETAPL